MPEQSKVDICYCHSWNTVEEVPHSMQHATHTVSACLRLMLPWNSNACVILHWCMFWCLYVVHLCPQSVLTMVVPLQWVTVFQKLTLVWCGEFMPFMQCRNANNIRNVYCASPYHTAKVSWLDLYQCEVHVYECFCIFIKGSSMLNLYNVSTHLVHSEFIWHWALFLLHLCSMCVADQDIQCNVSGCGVRQEWCG